MSSDLIVKFGSIQGLTLFPEDRGTVTITVTNQGDRQVNGPITFDLFASTDSVLDRVPLNILDDRLEGKDELLGRVTNQAFNLAPGRSTTLTLDFARLDELRTPSVVSPGAYYLIGQIDSNNIVVENDETNNTSSAFVSTDGTDVVLDWNSTFLNATQFLATRPLTSPPFQAHDAAILHTAIFDAVNAFEDRFTPYQVGDIDPPEGASIEAAAVGAAYQTLISLFSPGRFLVEQISGEQLPELSEPTQLNLLARTELPELSFQTQVNARTQSSQQQELTTRLETVIAEFEAQRIRSLDEITDDQAAITAGFDFGVTVANRILFERQNDGALEAALTDGVFTPRRGLGDWRPTPPDFLPALLPDWGNVTTFSGRSVEELREAAGVFGPPDFGSEQYLDDLNEVLAFGRRTGSERTEDQTQIALFWAYDRPDTFRPPGQWNEIAQEVALQQGNTLVDNARLFAMLNTALADAGILAWDAKYDFQQLRPITAIRQTTDQNWTPLLDTPPFPDYISGHAIFGGAAAGVLRSFFGDNVSFDIPSQELPGVYRTYSSTFGEDGNLISDSFTFAANENADSRVYGGVHVRSSQVTGIQTLRLGDVVVDLGVAAGLAVANFLSDNMMSAV